MADRVGEAMRLDRFLWWTRIAKTRSFAQGLAEGGRLRIDGRLVERAAAGVRIGNVLTFATRSGEVRVIRIEALPTRRGPPPEAQACYQELTLANDSQRTRIIDGRGPAQ